MNLKERIEISKPTGKEEVQTLEDVIAAVNDLRAKYTAHIANAVSHASADETNTLSGTDVTTLENRS